LDGRAVRLFSNKKVALGAAAAVGFMIGSLIGSAVVWLVPFPLGWFGHFLVAFSAAVGGDVSMRRLRVGIDTEATP